MKNQKRKTKKEVGGKTHWFPQIFSFSPKKMELEDREKIEDWEPITDIEVDRWIEEENEKEIARLEKLTRRG